ncbi:cytochrome b [Dichotomicrobium thermohalophilum]|uniref:Cytochrome b561 n=1 Tax=Dichotomicrobium thermohalophilum TaxID=933063 RepID=A0A397Q1T7_9HYPH|nr:cytochrome b [Dichotomicrobium thermohalophilum]RIA55018.1 cytochrome b561 [Dichotomicrobium thermohalophilum]
MATATAVERDYSLVAKVLHWLVAACVIFIIPAGIVMVNVELPDATRNTLYNLHKSFGVLILGLMAVRVGYRLTFGAPAASGALTPTQYLVSRIVHFTLYVLLIAMPILGWAGTSAFPAPVPVFGLFEMPALVGEDRELSKQLLAIHGYLGFFLTAVAILHIAAGLYHGVIRRDGVLSRMI